MSVWELRIGDFRVFYDVDVEGLVVTVQAIRLKPPTLSTNDQFWTLISQRRRQQTISRAELERRIERRDAAQQTLTPTVVPAIAEPKADYQVSGD